jgi:putative nucleotidyltransferase with HDIG domain
MAVLILALVGIASMVAAYDQTAALIPIAFPALVVAMLWDGRLALNLSLIMAILLTGQPAFLGMASLLTLVTAGAVASLAVRVVRRRAEIWGFIALIAGSYVVVSVVLGMLRSWSIVDIAVNSGWGAVSAVACAFAAMGFLPVLESFTRITTDQTLLELADVNRPLLRRLSMEAPGTYAHSISVANLAEAATGAIDGNALLTRVGVYYHDVGKMARPHYFIENQPSGRNPHDKLKPAMSAQVIRGHVTEGLRMADEAKLPDCVRAFIAEHHGTQTISFFYDQAREADPDAELDPADFRYPGPRPQSPETAIVMLADSVESAARVLPDPTPENIRELVDRIVRGKMDAGQLDETPLTLLELTRIKEQFVSVLTGMYHQRIDYPPARDRGGDGPGTAGSDQAPDTAEALQKTVEAG